MTARIHPGVCLISLILTCPYLLAGCYSTAPAYQNNQTTTVSGAQNKTADKPEPSPGLPKEELGFLLSVEDTRWDGSKEASVLLRVENHSAEPVTLVGEASFLLVKSNVRGQLEEEGETFICPVDILKKTSSRIQQSTINLEAEQIMNVQIGLRDLMWKRGIYSVPPSQHLFAAVPPGDYRLYFEVRIRQTADKSPKAVRETPLTRQIKSNEVSISIQ